MESKLYKAPSRSYWMGAAYLAAGLVIYWFNMRGALGELLSFDPNSIANVAVFNMLALALGVVGVGMILIQFAKSIW